MEGVPNLMTRQFPRLFAWHVVRHAGRHKLLVGLNVFSVALGVSVYLAIQIANHSANQSFAASIDLVAGKANLEVRSPGGGFDERCLPKIQAAAEVKAATPLVDGYMTLPDFPGEYLQLLGIDIFTNLPFASFAVGGPTPAEAENLDIDHWLGDPHAVALTDEFARIHHFKLGDTLRVQVNGRQESLTIRSLIRLDQTAAGRGNSRIAAMDIGWAQEILGKQGKLSSVQILLRQPRETEAAVRTIQKLVPPDVTVEPPGQRSGQIERMLASFELNLGALSLISLLVGMFLIYNTIAASVVRRRIETGILRAIGATQMEVQCLFLAEALLFGVIGVTLGIAGGVVLARFLIGREIARVISTLYMLVSVDRLHLTPLLVFSAYFFGLGSVLTAAWLPAREGANANPVNALSLGLGATSENSRLHAPAWFLRGLLALALGVAAAMLSLTTGPAWLGFGSAFFVLLGFAFTAPAVTTISSRVLEALLRRSRERETEPAASGETGSFAFMVLLRLASQNLRRSLHRNAVIIAALMAAIAMTVGISVMIHAFRRTVEIWIDRAIVADLFMTPSANETLGNGAMFPPEVLAGLRHDPSVAAVDTVRELGVTIRGDRISMVSVSGDNRHRLAFVGGHGEEKQRAFYLPDHVLVTEPFAHRYHVKDGDRLQIPTPEGQRDFIIAGVYYDYSRDSGIVAISHENFVRHWHDERVMSVGLYLKDPSLLDATADHLRQTYNQHGEFLIYSNRAIRERVFEIFAQTFRITGVLRGIAVVIAVVGIFLTLTTLVTEREREIGVLRALGASRGQIQGIVLAESALIGLLSSLLGMLAGLCLSLVLTFVINKAFFGWTIQLAVPWMTVILTPLWIIAASLAAGWLPAIRAGRVPIAAAIRSE